MSRISRHHRHRGGRRRVAGGRTVARADGVPGLRGHDHTGITVPDIKQATDFFVNVLGCKEAMSFGPFADEKGDFMTQLLNVNPRAVINKITLVRCGYGSEHRAVPVHLARPERHDAEEQRHRRLSHRLLCRRHQSREGLSRRQGREDVLRPVPGRSGSGGRPEHHSISSRPGACRWRPSAIRRAWPTRRPRRSSCGRRPIRRSNGRKGAVVMAAGLCRDPRFQS